MQQWKTWAVRLAGLALGYAALWVAVLGFGYAAVPAVRVMDYPLSEAMNPDLYLPVLDEFFRALTDHTNFLIAVPLISLAVAVWVVRLIEWPVAKAAGWSLLSCALWGGLVYMLAEVLEADARTTLQLAALAPVVLLAGVLPPRLIPALAPRWWVGGLLVLESVLLLAAWASGWLFWNAELVGANWIQLAALLAVLAAMVHAFFHMGADARHRYGKLFLLVLASSLMVSLFATRSIKDSVARPRPLNDAHAPWNETLRPIPGELIRGASSYPSGHTSGTFALIAPLFWWTRSRGLRAGLLGWGVLQGVSRVYTVAHFTVDCIAGGILGFGTGTLVFFLLGGPATRPPEPDYSEADTPREMPA